MTKWFFFFSVLWGKSNLWWYQNSGYHREGKHGWARPGQWFLSCTTCNLAWCWATLFELCGQWLSWSIWDWSVGEKERALDQDHMSSSLHKTTGHKKWELHSTSHPIHFEGLWTSEELTPVKLLPHNWCNTHCDRSYLHGSDKRQSMPSFQRFSTWMPRMSCLSVWALGGRLGNIRFLVTHRYWST